MGQGGDAGQAGTVRAESAAVHPGGRERGIVWGAVGLPGHSGVLGDQFYLSFNSALFRLAYLRQTAIDVLDLHPDDREKKEF